MSTLWSSKGLHAAACVDGHVTLVRQERLRLSAVGDHDPNWTQDGVAGWDLD